MRRNFQKAIASALDQARRAGNPERLPRQVAVVVYVHVAQGILDNGGFQYFFEADFPGKPPYTRFVEAYREIGATDQADIIEQALKVFPFKDAHKHRKDREKVLSGFRGDDGDPVPASPLEMLDAALCGNKDVWKLLDSYISKHASYFSGE